jgi:hypothetical protein
MLTIFAYKRGIFVRGLRVCKNVRIERKERAAMAAALLPLQQM